MRPLTRMWQMLLKALEEVAAAPNPMMAAEMAVIRLTHVAELPSPEELVRRLSDPAPAPGPAAAARAPARPRGAAGPTAAAAPAIAAGQAMPAPAAPAPETAPLARYERFEDVLALVRARRDMSLLVEIETGVRLVRYAPGPHRVRARRRRPRPISPPGWRSGCRP